MWVESMSTEIDGNNSIANKILVNEKSTTLKTIDNILFHLSFTHPEISNPWNWVHSNVSEFARTKKSNEKYRWNRIIEEDTWSWFTWSNLETVQQSKLIGEIRKIKGGSQKMWYCSRKEEEFRNEGVFSNVSQNEIH